MDNLKKTHTNKPNNLIQQTLHPRIFERVRSNSLGALPNGILKPAVEKQPKQADKLSDTENSDEVGWQSDKIPVSRQKRKERSPIQGDENKRPKNTTTFQIQTQNRFDLLSDEPTNESTTKTKEYIPKPEPIFVTGVVSIASLKEKLNKLIENNLYTMTTLRSGHIIKIMPSDIQTYKVIRENFIENNISHYTYQLKSEKAYRVVIRGLHASEDKSQLVKELESVGHKVRQIVNIQHRATKEPIPVFYVDLEPQHNNKDIFNLRYLNQMKISVEAPYKKKEIIQCKRCQRFGHSKNHCNRPFRCVKCGSDHPTATCTKKPDTVATCANCDEKHPASYKGCKVYKQYRERILKTTVKPTEKQEKKTFITPLTEAEFIPRVPLPQVPRLKKTYSEIAKSHPRPAQIDDTKDLNNMTETTTMDILIDKMQQTMMTMMENMLDKMLDRMVQLFHSLIKK